ncbi:hypothetical protein DSO57_1013506 [Entomophthora muscae]|uniref:Uncharacterized protein n=1 Tax=Entomophthora muscae TaxID=34485 RepID=A0ACC2TG93_9FUNG|nr:hypothetical protein DSO57_1013506 [Entomophthora muscae]
MTLSLTLRPNHPQESVATDESTSTQIFGPQSCGGLSLLGPRAVWPQVPRNPPQVGSLTGLCDSKNMVGVTKVMVSKPQAEIKLAPSHQVGLAGGGDFPTPGFLLFEVNPGAGIIPDLMAAEGPVLGPKSYTQAFVGLAGPGQAFYSCPVNPDQAHPPFCNLGSPIGDPFFNQVLWAQESLSSQSKNGD